MSKPLPTESDYAERQLPQMIECADPRPAGPGPRLRDGIMSEVRPVDAVLRRSQPNHAKNQPRRSLLQWLLRRKPD